MTNNAWHWWQEALANPNEIGQPHLPVSVDSPEQGFYRTRYKGKPWEPVAIWYDGNIGTWLGLRSGKVANAHTLWNWCCRHPISAEAYEKALNGYGWDDDDPTVASMIGHNVGDVSEFDTLKDQIESARQGAEAYATIENDDQAGKAQSLRARMNELAGKADKQREALKRPHLEAGKAVDAEWMPLVKEAKGVADLLRGYIASFETAKLRERRRLEAERQVGEPSAPPPIEPDKVKGNYGRAASIGTELVVTEITDQDALWQFLRGHPDLMTFMLNLAQRALRTGQTVPGIAFEERAKV